MGRKRQRGEKRAEETEMGITEKSLFSPAQNGKKKNPMEFSFPMLTSLTETILFCFCRSRLKSTFF